MYVQLSHYFVLIQFYYLSKVILDAATEPIDNSDLYEESPIIEKGKGFEKDQNQVVPEPVQCDDVPQGTPVKPGKLV